MLFLTNVYGQSASPNSQLPTVTLPSKQTQLYEQYINCPVSYETGVPSITIPLYEIEVDGLKIPLNLTYHSSGIKFRQHDGDIAAGWVLNPGYRLSRTIYGKADETATMYPGSKNEADFGFDDKFLSGLVPEYYGYPYDPNGKYDTEYDQYTYSIPNDNGHFIVDNGKVVMLEAEKNNISMERICQIKDDNNFLYTMASFNHEDREKANIPAEYVPFTSHRTSPHHGKVTAWPLMQISSPRKRSVNFTYSEGDIIFSQQHTSTSTVYDYANNDDQDDRQNPFSNINTAIYRGSTFYLRTISSDKEYIEIQRVSDTSDGFGVGSSRLTNNKVVLISIYRKVGNVKKLYKTVHFGYSKQGWHRLLDSVSISTYQENGSQTYETYLMTYNGGSIDGLYPDQWGYYKKRNSVMQINNQTAFLHEEFQQDGRTPIHGLFQKRLVFQAPFHMVNRTENSDASAYSLSSITYPTGGSWKFEYEANRYTKPGTNEIVEGGGQRIKKITMYDSPKSKAKILEYKYGKNEDRNGCVNFAPNAMHFSTPGALFKMRTTPACQTEVSSSEVRYYSPNMMGTASIDKHFILYYPEVSEYVFDEVNKIYSGKTVRNYSLPQDPFPLGYPANISHTNHGAYVGTYNYGYKVNIDSVRFYSYNPASIPFAPSWFKLIRKEIYKYRHTENRTIYENINIFPYLIYELFIEGSRIKGNPLILGNSYWDWIGSLEASLGGNSYPPHWETCGPEGDIPWSMDPTINPFYKDASNRVFEYQGYTIGTGTYLMNQKTETDYLPSGNITKVTDYTYNTNHQLSSTTESVNGKDPVIKTYMYKWEADKNKSWNRDNYLVETRTQKGTAVSAELISYTGFYIDSDRIEMGTAFSSLITTNNDTRNASSSQASYMWPGRRDPVYIWEYDTYGNPVDSFGEDEDKHTTYVWGHKGCHLIAHIENLYYGNLPKDISWPDLDRGLVPDEDMRKLAKALREKLPYALVTVYLYDSFGEVKEVIDPKGLSTYYEYDTGSRLKCIKDMNGNIIEQYSYNVTNQ